MSLSASPTTSSSFVDSDQHRLELLAMLNGFVDAIDGVTQAIVVGDSDESVVMSDGLESDLGREIVAITRAACSARRAQNQGRNSAIANSLNDPGVASVAFGHGTLAFMSCEQDAALVVLLAEHADRPYIISEMVALREYILNVD